MDESPPISGCAGPLMYIPSRAYGASASNGLASHTAGQGLPFLP